MIDYVVVFVHLALNRRGVLPGHLLDVVGASLSVVMAAHIVYEDIDPQLPSSASPTIINDVIRGDIGFDGLLVSDDLDMDALDGLGDVADRSLAVLEAGCDVALYCSGKLSDMQNIAKSVPNLSARAQKTLQNSWKPLKLAV